MQKRPCMARCINVGLVLVSSVFIIAFVILRHTHAEEEHATAGAAQPDPLLVLTKYGQVRGIYSNGVRVFHGISYAQAPIGDLRWRPPLEPKPWSDIFNASNIRPGCPQECVIPLYCSKQSSEDCLFLEIYAPSAVQFPVPVLVVIHGGSFKDVTSTLPIYDASKFVERSGIIVVLVEYRLGALGFLVTGSGEDDARGNYGLLDQILALKWVRENIGAFGGDPDKVTLNGQSAGAQSTLIHLVSEDSSRYFRSAIVESPPLSLPYKTPKVARKHGQAFAGMLGCLDKNSTVSVPCLRNKTAAEILRAQKKAEDEDFSYFEKLEPWGPVGDKKIVNGQVLTALRAYANSSRGMKPIMWGYTGEEAVLFVNSILTSPVPEFMYGVILDIALTSTPEAVTKLYPVTNVNDTREDLSVLFTDAIFRCPIRQVVQLLAQTAHSNNVWVYRFDQPIGNQLPDNFSFCTGRSCHGTTIPFVLQSFDKVFGETFPEDIETSNSLIDFYGNFIKFGDPNGENKAGDHSNTETKHGADSLSEASKIVWPAVKESQANVITELLFARDGHLEVTSQDTDQRCQAWAKANYPL